MGFLFWLVIGVVVFYLLSGRGRTDGWPWMGQGRGPASADGPFGNGTAPAETPRQILDRRLAKGEITVEEYRRILQELGSQ
ncbi:MAG: SHOCT domain-containing protein [Chitinophagales bacterium]